ncbi:MAG: energy transducer TonB [Bacteroidetes bacterium]|nr:energy transducer TonB [Bacteroidota bacterium]MBU1721046.1 energy transducer TonB [Bacteroidota bacterium]
MKKLLISLQIQVLRVFYASVSFLWFLTRRKYFFDQKLKAGVLIIAAMALWTSCGQTDPYDGNGTGETDTQLVTCYEPVVETSFRDTSTLNYVDISESAVYDFPEVFLEYPGGQAAMNKYLMENLTYPTLAKDSGVQGTVYLRFVVDTDGSITDLQVLNEIGLGCDEEAIRVVQSMPKWKPALMKGKPMPCRINLPVKFVLR